jgi:hypothetical protein
MKKAFAALAAVMALAAAPPRAAAQGTLPLSAGVRFDAAIPTGNFSESFISGLGWAADVGLDLSPTFSLYGAYSRFEFPVTGENDVKARDDGFSAGGKLMLGTGGGIWTPFLQFGALFHDDTGFEVGLGADYPINPAVSLAPLARYRKVGEASYVTLGLGLRLRP